ncbi:MAG: dihydrolipoyl dehydrogenase [Rhodospirillaceae bacterium]|nr:dihydrolipoyl dehydrogenase [Rhodospirillaceae bacterium]
MTNSQMFDLAIIGGGPGGYVAAIRAAQLGLKVALIEKEHLGGICLNWGCIPTKALLRSAEVYQSILHAKDYGLTVKEVAFDLKSLVDRSRKIAAQLSSGVKHLLKKNNVAVFDGRGKITAAGKISVVSATTTTNIEASHIIIATGARAKTLPHLQPDGKLVWTYKEAMIPTALPKSLMVIGSGAIGIEFASFYNALGCQVSVIEMQNKILPVEDDEISAAAQKIFEKKGIKFYTNSTVTKIDKTGNAVSATVKTSQNEIKLTADRIIVAIGITANTEDLGLEQLSVELTKGHIKTDEWGKTNVKGIYAIGDVAGAPWLAHKASHEGVVCVEKIAGLKSAHPINLSNIPACTYSMPQIASVGLTEQALKAAGRAIKVGKFPFIGNGKAIALGEVDGFIKTIFDAQTGELLGAHMIGAEVTELIQGYTIAKTLETTEQELISTIFAHPTLSEMMHESVLNAYNQTIHF